MKLLAISGSTRRDSTNTALLRAVSDISPSQIEISVFDDLVNLPIFSPDIEGSGTPRIIEVFCDQIHQADGLIISSPEYVRAIPGGLKNAIDWLVSRDEVINKPTVLVHASHRGDDMLQTLRAVLSTVTAQFNENLFLRFPLMAKSPDAIRHVLSEPDNIQKMSEFIARFCSFVDACDRDLQGSEKNKLITG